MQRVAFVSLLIAGCGLVRVNGKPLGGSTSSSSPPAAAPASRRVDDPVGEMHRRRAAAAAQEPQLAPLKQATLPAELGTKPMIVDAEATPSAPFTKRWDFAGQPCAEAMAPAALVEFEVTAATSPKLQVRLNHGPEGLLLERPDGTALISCAGGGNDAFAGIWMPKAGWPPGKYRVYLTAYRAAKAPIEVEVQFSVIEPARPAKEVWTEDCFADFADLRAKWGPVETSTRAALAAIDGRDFYRDYPKLVALYRGLRTQMAALKINAGASWQHATSAGIALEVRKAITELVVRHHRDYSDPAPLGALAMPRFTTGDDAFERTAYCYEATAIGSPRVKPHWEGHLDEAPAWLKRPEQRAFLERYNRLREDGRIASAFKASRKVGTDAGYVGAIKRAGKDVAIVLETYDSRPECWETNKVERVRADGSVEYRVECSGKMGPQQTFRRKVLIAADLLPSTPALKAKDYVSFFVDPDTLVADKPSRGLSVQLIQRGEKETMIGDWRLDANAQ